jgi:hypothetical protein
MIITKEIQYRVNSGNKAYLQKTTSSVLNIGDVVSTYQGTYELDFLALCTDLGFRIEDAHTIRYFYDGKTRSYFPDFYYRPLNLIIEIKSTYTYESNIDKNLAKRNAAIKAGFDFIFIIDKNYDEFINILNNNEI